jgi:exopolyphosphatase/guanosine-5'-triphosphate,3'-diphosphate pyrophosphatase
MSSPEKVPDAPAAPARPAGAPPLAVIDMGASAVRLTVAETGRDGALRILEESSRGVLLGKDAFTHGRITAPTMEATLKVLEGFRRIVDGYGVVRLRAVATSAVREAANRDTFIDRIRLRTGLNVEVIDGSEENRLTYMAVRDALGEHPALKKGTTLLVEIGGGSGDLSILLDGEPKFSGTYALGAIRLRQSLGSWKGTHERKVRLLTRHIRNVIEDIKREVVLREVRHFIALGGDVRFAASRLAPDEKTAERFTVIEREPFLAVCDELSTTGSEVLAERFRLSPADAETLGPALLAYRALLEETEAREAIVPVASLRRGLLLDMTRGGEAGRMADLSRQVLASAAALGEKYRFDAAHGHAVAHLATRLFDDLRPEHGLSDRDRLLLMVAAMLHDIGIHVNRNAHHKHSQYLLVASDIFGLSREDLAIIGNVARYHRRALPQKSHLAYAQLDREARVRVAKLGALARLANALDAEHMQKIWDLHVLRDVDEWVLEVEGTGDLTMERLAVQARADLFTEVFGRRLEFRVTTKNP